MLGALTHRLQRRAACKIKNGDQRAPKWLRGSGKGSIPRFVPIYGLLMISGVMVVIKSKSKIMIIINLTLPSLVAVSLKHGV